MFSPTRRTLPSIVLVSSGQTRSYVDEFLPLIGKVLVSRGVLEIVLRDQGLSLNAS